ncbi:hypothetical protein H5410_049960 [Solanum commersonii]|uniref:Uncharacterized protein n=1 Tax=Solanum commersonii TaxID=4109 RepID=A0A9J5WVP9_SOLCO|nr:hypothetical protein H5410_049960 [Solanum commersonii]
MKLLDKLDTIQLEITIQAELEEIEAQQGERYGETEILQESIRDGLTYMTTQLIEGRVELTQEIDQFGSDIHELETDLNKKIEASEAQLPIVVDDDQLVKKKEEFHPFNYSLFLNINIEKEYKREVATGGDGRRRARAVTAAAVAVAAAAVEVEAASGGRRFIERRERIRYPKFGAKEHV